MLKGKKKEEKSRDNILENFPIKSKVDLSNKSINIIKDRSIDSIIVSILKKIED